MLESGRYHTLKIKEFSKGEAVLDGGDCDIRMPASELPKGALVGQKQEVFVYTEKEGQLTATTLQPKAFPGDFAALRVTGETGFGLFLDWGLRKDLLLPKNNIKTDLKRGDTAVVHIMRDVEMNNVVATGYIEPYLKKDAAGEMEVNQEVSLLVYGFNELGFRVIVDNKFTGILYKNEVFRDFRVGDESRGFIKKVREDGKLDVALQPQGYKAAVSESRTVLEQAFERYKGFIPLNDKSSPDEINLVLNMSKKVFKKTVGALLKEGFLTIEEKGIRKTNK